LKLVHQVRRFAVGKDGDGITKAGDWAGEQLGGNVDGTGLAAGTVTGKGSTSSGGGMRVEDLAEVGWSAEVDGGGYFQEIESGGV
jgi:hypothetical protein